ncbi:MAG: hypothetical protein U1E83_08485 [Methylotetracoccus sp.]
MLMGAFAAFSLVAAMGLAIVRDVWRGRAVDPFYPVVHGAAALFGSALVILVALEGDHRLYVNIGLAVVIILLGVLMGLQSKRGKKVSRGILAAHVSLALVCYGLLAFLTLNPHATIPGI